MQALCRYGVVIGALLAVAVGCQRRAEPSERYLDESALARSVAIDHDKLRVRTDRVGHGRWESEASFVLVDVESRHDQDLMVTLGGELVSSSGAALGPLRPASLRVPAGGVRTFALVDKQQRAHPAVADARVAVLGAFVPQYEPPVVVTDGHVYRDGDRVVVNARIRNTADGPVRVIVLAGFYDPDGMPMTRPFTDMYIPGHGQHTAEFVGPPGSAAGYIFIGDMVY